MVLPRSNIRASDSEKFRAQVEGDEEDEDEEKEEKNPTAHKWWK